MMTFRRGIFMGIVMLSGSVSEIINRSGLYFWEINRTWSFLLLSFFCVLGIIQVVASVNYLKVPNLQLLLICFVLEGVYYVISSAFLINMKADIEIKIFGVVISFLVLMVICSAISTLLKKIADLK